jgi:hypothetical protein
MMEVGIWRLSGKSAKDNCKLVNLKTAGKKKAILAELLLGSGQQEVHDALQEVFSVADRNGWIHGHVLNPNGDFSRLTRLRIEKRGADLIVNNSTISFDLSPFELFYEAYGKFEAKSQISKGMCNEYIDSLQAA